MALISKGNMKIGKIANVSLTPGRSCAGCAETCLSTCYAMKAYRQYPNVRTAWDKNFDAASADRAGFFAAIDRFLASYRGTHFRWHVAGDILDEQYLESMVALAIKYPLVSFLAFTKRYDVVARSTLALPVNFSLIISAWPGRALSNPRGLPVAWMQDGSEVRVPPGAQECPGSCVSCRSCWSLAREGRDVVFHKH